MLAGFVEVDAFDLLMSVRCLVFFDMVGCDRSFAQHTDSKSGLISNLENYIFASYSEVIRH